MRRRGFLKALASAVPAPFLPVAARAQGKRPYRIAMLPDMWDVFRNQFVDAMQERGWRLGPDFVLFRPRTPLGPRIEDTCREVVDARPDLIYAINTAYALAAQRMTGTIPIVMVASGYPVEAGVADTMARPGRNVTGNAGYAGTDFHGKMLELLREVKPGVRHATVLWSYAPPAHPRAEIDPCYAEMRAAARRLDMELQIEELAATEAVEPALARLAEAGTGGIYVTAGPALWAHAARVDRFAREHRIPAVADWSWDAAFYPLLIYTPNYLALTRQAVSYVDRILRGAKPGELPIQQPSKFDLIINLSTAKAIGLAIPRSILLRADRFLE